jgi:hypothetical protein
MTYVKKILIGLLILTTLNFYIPGIAISGEIILSSRENITTHSPESVSTPEKDIPGEATVTSEKGSETWLWAVVSIAAIVGIVAGSGSGGGNSGGNNGGSTGSINVSW